MIYTTQGHEKGIGLEVFIKSFICLPNNLRKEFTLICYEESLIQTLKSINISISYFKSIIKVIFLESTAYSQTLSCLLHSFSLLKPNDILLTLPSSKDQFKYQNKNYSGHTEFFRNYFNNSDISMNFISDRMNLLLLSDHIPLSSVSTFLSKDRIIKLVKSTLDNIPVSMNLNEVLFSGINPHCGENGLIGDSDFNISEAISSLKINYPYLNFVGPLAGDTLHFCHKNINQLLVYAFHDQGLTIFKQQNGLMGINTSLGMPFIRVSPDHGTAFDLFGKNMSNYQGMLFLLSKITKWK